MEEDDPLRIMLFTKNHHEKNTSLEWQHRYTTRHPPWVDMAGGNRDRGSCVARSLGEVSLSMSSWSPASVQLEVWHDLLWVMPAGE